MQIQPSQLRALYAMLKHIGLDTRNRSVRLSYVNGFRLAHGLVQVESFSTMTAEEAAQLQRALSKMTGEE